MNKDRLKKALDSGRRSGRGRIVTNVFLMSVVKFGEVRQKVRQNGIEKCC